MCNVELYNPAPSVSNILDRVGVIIPTYNAAKHWTLLRHSLDHQAVRPSQVVIIDSSSSDETASLAQEAGYTVVTIRKQDFGHGATRQYACGYLPKSDFLVFMTQDAILAGPGSIELLCESFLNPAIGAVYGRQLPREDADPIERHGRLFNYPAHSQVRDLESRHGLGFRTAFFSNSFSAYRRTALEEVGGFPRDAIVSEEVTVIARMLIAGWKIAYKAEAQVIHSHHLGLAQEFSRYFDIGVHHGRTPWLLQEFGTANGNGLRYVKSEFQFLMRNAPLWLPYAALRSISKLTAHRLGIYSRLLPNFLSRALSAHPNYWDSEATASVSGVVPAARSKLAASKPS